MRQATTVTTVLVPAATYCQQGPLEYRNAALQTYYNVLLAELRHKQKGAIKHSNLFVTRKNQLRKHCTLSLTLKEQKLIYSPARRDTR